MIATAGICYKSQVLCLFTKQLFMFLLTFIHKICTVALWLFRRLCWFSCSEELYINAFNCVGCGVRDDHYLSKGRIVGGHPATPAEFGWTVALVRTSSSPRSTNGRPFCGGSLISDRYGEPASMNFFLFSRRAG